MLDSPRIKPANKNISRWRTTHTDSSVENQLVKKCLTRFQLFFSISKVTFGAAEYCYQVNAHCRISSSGKVSIVKIISHPSSTRARPLASPDRRKVKGTP